MSDDKKVVAFRQPDAIDDPLTAILRAGARRLLEQAIEAEVENLPCRDEGSKAAGRSRPAGSARSRPGAVGPDRDRRRFIPAGEGAGSRRRRRRRPSSFQFGDPAGVGAANQKPGRIAADPLPARDFQRRLSGRAERLAGLALEKWRAF